MTRLQCIGVVHLLPLPGSPRHDKIGGMAVIIERATSDAKRYLDAGFDGVIIENFGDVPFYPGRVPPETVAAMARVAGTVLDRLDPPGAVGINVLRNDTMSALAVAKAVGASFIRVNVHSGTVIADQGLITGVAHETLRYREAIDAGGIDVWADVRVKHAVPLVQKDMMQECSELVERALAKALIFTGTATGVAPSKETLDGMKTIHAIFPGAPLYLGSGVSTGNIDEIMETCDGAVAGCIVGSSVKHGGLTINPVDPDRARAFIDRARRAGS